MSQEKVARYKEQKAHRKEIVKKQKRKQMLSRCIWSVVGLALVAGIGYSVYDLYDRSRPREVAEVDYTEFENYLTNLSAEDAE